MTSLQGRTAVVTGAAGGLGVAVAHRLAADGATIALLDVSLDALEQLAAAIAETGAPPPLAFACDVTDVDRVEEVAREVGPCDVLVNNAAVYRRAPLEEHSLELWDLTISVNLRGYFVCTRAFGRSMLANGAGSIVNVASIAAQGPTPGAVSYCVSKAAIVSLTRQTALEWGPRGVRTNAVSPGFMSTPMSSAFGRDALVQERMKRVPVGRIGTTEEVARTIAFLAGDGASYVNGVNITIDGGVTQTLSQTFPR